MMAQWPAALGVVLFFLYVGGVAPYNPRPREAGMMYPQIIALVEVGLQVVRIRCRCKKLNVN